MKLQSVKIENMHHVIEKEYNFDDVNYLYGQNGAGKSTALQAVQLALLGYIPGTPKQNSAIFRHARGKFMSVTAVLVDNDGNEISVCRTYTGTDKSAKSTVEIIPDAYDIEFILTELELPIFNFNEFTNMSANKLKDWFIQFLPSGSEEVNWNNALSSALGDKIHVDAIPIEDELLEKIGELSKDYEGVELVRQVNAYLKTCISFEKGSIDRLQSTIQSLVFYDDCADVDEESIARYSQELNDLQALSRSLSAYDALAAQKESVEKQLDELKSSISSETYLDDKMWQEANDAIVKGNEELKTLTAKSNELVNRRAEISTEITTKRNIINGKGICPFTKSSCESITKLVEELTKECEGLEREYFENKSKQDEVSSKIDELRQKMDAADKTRRSLETVYSRYEMAKQQFEQTQLPDRPTTSTQGDISKRCVELTDKITKAQANIKFNVMNSNLTKDKFKSELKLSVYKAWEKLTAASGKLQADLSEKPFRDMEEEMTKHLKNMFSDDVKMKFYLSDKANSFSFGLERNDKYIPFDLLSSGEKCLYTLAMMICLTQVSRCPLKLILIDDLLDHLDDDKAEKLFESLSNLKEDVQIILAGVKEVKSKKSSKIVIEVK